MIKVAATPANDRKEKILQAVQNMNFAADPFAQSFGISVDSKMAQVRGNESRSLLLHYFVWKVSPLESVVLYPATGRVLPAPTLVYGHNETSFIVPKDGVWNMINHKFIDAKSMSHFGVINITRTDDRAINTFIGALTAAGSKMGIVRWSFFIIVFCIFKYKYLKTFLIILQEWIWVNVSLFDPAAWTHWRLIWEWLSKSFLNCKFFLLSSTKKAIQPMVKIFF